jgi:hypothetical protein
MRKIFLSSLLGLCLLVALLGVPVLAESEGTNEKPIWLAVTRPVFLEAVKPLAEVRSKDGFETVVSTKPIGEALAALKRRPAFLLLVGDDELGKQKEPWYVPSRRRKLYRWRAPQKKEFASDTLWGDFNSDLIPDIPVGRIPVRTAEQLKVVVNKIIAFEQKQPALDDLRLPIWAGAAGYNSMVNTMTTGLLLNTVRTNASEWSRPWIISADTSHSLCGWPFDQPGMFTRQLKRGGVMTVLMGHADSNHFFSMVFQGKGVGYVPAHFEDVLAAGKPGPPTVIIACSAGSFTGPRNCLCESLLLTPGGPVAVIGATTESHPLTNYFSGLCLVRERGEKDKRLGTVWLAAQQKAMKTRDFIIERMLVNIEGKLEEKMNVARLRRDQILMYALLGDPATRLHLPDKLGGKIERLDDGWHWQVDKPKDATRLYVGLRPAGQNFPTAELPLEKEAARKRFDQANATFDFQPLAELAADKAWKGTINKEGTLRFVAVARKRIYAVTFDLKFPDT